MRLPVLEFDSYISSMRFWIAGVACAAYGTVGVFGASLYGDATESNIMWVAEQHLRMPVLDP